MNNQELQKKIKEIINIDNFFDMVIIAQKFEKVYKTSDFYKATKMPLYTMIQSAKKWYTFNAKDIQNKIQGIINDLSLEHLDDIMHQLSQTFEIENQETKQFLEDFKNITK